MKLNSTQNIHGILQGFNTLTGNAVDGCRTALHNGTLFCVYLGEGRTIMYLIKPQFSTWGNPTRLQRFTADNGYRTDNQPEDHEHQNTLEHSITCRNIPSLVSFNEKLWLIYTDDVGVTVFRAWDDSHATFVHAAQRDLNVDQAATYAQLNNNLYMFYKLHNGTNIYCTSTSNMQTWTRSALLKQDDVKTLTTQVSPAAITYQGLIHLIYKDRPGGFYLLKSDGEHWTSPIPFVNVDYDHSPGIAIHNGLLKLIFSNSVSASSALHQYGYDGNALSPVMESTMLSAGGSPALDTQDGTLIATYLASAPSR